MNSSNAIASVTCDCKEMGSQVKDESLLGSRTVQ